MAASTNVLCVCEYYQFNYNLFSIHPGITYYLDQQMYHAGRDNLYVSVAPVHDRYQKAGIFRAIMLACNLITAFIVGSVILTLAASIVSIIAVYQEYSAHAEVITEKDSKLGRA